MIGCDFCDEWYHYNCLNLTKAEAKELTKKEWTCPNCEFKSSGIHMGVSREWEQEAQPPWILKLALFSGLFRGLCPPPLHPE